MNGTYTKEIAKQIKITYVDQNLVEDLTNTVKGKVELYGTEEKDEKEATHETRINIDGTIITKYIDIKTGEEIAEKETITNKVGTTYETEQKEIENYEFVRSTNNTKGSIKEGTQEEKTYRYEIIGNAGDKYKTEQKDISYYKLVKVPVNSIEELTENGDTVIYYYQKKIFNIAVEKELQRVVFNGEEKNITNKKAMKMK